MVLSSVNQPCLGTDVSLVSVIANLLHIHLSALFSMKKIVVKTENVNVEARAFFFF